MDPPAREGLRARHGGRADCYGDGHARLLTLAFGADRCAVHATPAESWSRKIIARRGLRRSEPPSYTRASKRSSGGRRYDSRCGISAPEGKRGGAHVTRVRLHRRGRRVGRMRPGSPAHGGPGHACPAHRGRRPRPESEHQDPGGLRQAVPHQARLGLLHGARAARRRPVALRAARQEPGRLELDERDALRPRAAARLRPLGGAGRRGLELARRPALLPQVRGRRARRVGVPRRGRAAAGVEPALTARRGRPPPDRRERGGRHPEKPRLQRTRAGRRGDVPGQPARRPALERRRRLPAPGAQTAEPRGDDADAGPARRIRGRPGGRGANRGRGADASARFEPSAR